MILLGLALASMHTVSLYSGNAWLAKIWQTLYICMIEVTYLSLVGYNEFCKLKHFLD